MKLIIRAFKIREFTIDPEFIKKAYELLEPILPHGEMKDIFNVESKNDFKTLIEFVDLINTPFNSGMKL